MKNYVIRFGSGDSRNSSGLAPTMLIFANAASGATLAAPAISEIGTTFGLYTFQWGTTTPIAFLCDGATTGLGGALRYITGMLDPSDRADEYGTSMVALGTTGVALGTTNVALGTTNVALGTTNVALGVTNVALGTSGVALGATNVAIGTTIYALEQNIGTSIIAMGTSLNAMGVSLSAMGVTLSGIGVTIAVSFSGIGTVGSTFGGAGTDPIDLFGYLKRIQENLEGNSTFVKQPGTWSIYSRGSSQLLITKTIANGTSVVSKT